MCQKNGFQVFWGSVKGVGDISKDLLCFLRHARIDEGQLRTIYEIAMGVNAFYQMNSWDNLRDVPPRDSR